MQPTIGKAIREELVKLRDFDKTLQPKLIEETKKYKASGWKKKPKRT